MTLLVTIYRGVRDAFLKLVGSRASDGSERVTSSATVPLDIDEIQDTSIYIKPYQYPKQYRWYIENLDLCVSPFFDLDGEMRGHLFRANQVQIILTESGCFVPAEIFCMANFYNCSSQQKSN